MSSGHVYYYTPDEYDEIGTDVSVVLHCSQNGLTFSRLRLVAYLISIPPPGVSSPVGGVPGMFRPGADPGVIERDLNIQSGPGNGISGKTGGCD